MSLRSLVGFCARRPFLIVGLWVVLMVLSAFLSRNYLDDALQGGQGATQDLEFKLAQDLRDEKLSALDAESEGSSDEESKGVSSDNLLVVTSSKYSFPSEEYLLGINGFFEKLQSAIDEANLVQSVGTVSDYQPNPSEDLSTVMISVPFVEGKLVAPLMHIAEDYSNDDFQFYFIGTASIEHTFQELAEKDLITGETIGISVATVSYTHLTLPTKA